MKFKYLNIFLLLVFAQFAISEDVEVIDAMKSGPHKWYGDIYYAIEKSKDISMQQEGFVIESCHCINGGISYIALIKNIKEPNEVNHGMIVSHGEIDLGVWEKSNWDIGEKGYIFAICGPGEDKDLDYAKRMEFIKNNAIGDYKFEDLLDSKGNKVAAMALMISDKSDKVQTDAVRNIIIQTFNQ